MNHFYTLKNFISTRIRKVKWRKSNTLNQTWLGDVKNSDCFSIGKMTWGELNTVDYLPQSSTLCHISIGSYCSIAGGTRFLRGGEHRLDRISTFLFKSCYGLGTENNLKESRDIVVGDDVWIGFGCLILPGTQIGQGAIIGAGSVVRGIIPPYSVYAYDRVIKKRFNNETIDKLLQIDYSKLSRETIVSSIDLLYSDVTNDNIAKLVEEINQTKNEEWH